MFKSKICAVGKLIKSFLRGVILNAVTPTGEPSLNPGLAMVIKHGLAKNVGPVIHRGKYTGNVFLFDQNEYQVITAGGSIPSLTIYLLSDCGGFTADIALYIQTMEEAIGEEIPYHIIGINYDAYEEDVVFSKDGLHYIATPVNPLIKLSIMEK